MSWRPRLFSILEGRAHGDPIARWYDPAMMGLILANVAAVVLGTVESIHAQYHAEFRVFEHLSLAVFSVEYLLRMWACGSTPSYAGWRGRLRYALRPLVLIDLLSIAPGLLKLEFDARFLRGLRVFRLLRLFKLTRYSSSLQTFGRVLRRCAPELMSTLFVLLLLLVIASSLMYYLERGTNPAFSSIPAAMWWGIATFTTVGYGDITPITPAGRLLGGCVAILGIAMFAIPAGVVGAAFSEEWRKQRRDDDQ
jgi:voltage-gated potassium channel